MFDWQTEEDEAVWEDEAAPQPQKTAVSRKRQWMMLLFIGLLVVGTGFFVVQQVQEQAEAAVATVETDIISTHELIMAAAEAGDADLMRAMLSGRDRQWADVQQQLVAEGTLLDRASLGMTWQPTAQTVLTTTIDPALESAELLSAQSYRIVQPDGITETITLQHTAVYRRGSQRWLLAPLEDEFWGEWKTLDSDRLMLVFPSRDEAVAERLFADLETAVDDACALLNELDCDQTKQIRVRLEKDVATLDLLQHPELLYRRGLQQIKLPAPSLVGIPIDEAGYAALQRGYARVLVQNVIADTVGWTCCEHDPIFQTLVDYQLGQLDLIHWPVTLDDHIVLWEGQQLVSLNDLFEYWDQSSADELSQAEVRYLQASIDFLLRQYPHQSAANLQHTMTLPGISFLRWIRNLPLINEDSRFISPSALINSLDREWRLYALLQADVSTAETAPLPLPKQDIQLVCTREFSDSNETIVARYDMANDQWLEEDVFEDALILFFPTADDQTGVLLKLFWGTQEIPTEIETWRKGVVQSILADNRGVLSLGQLDPTGRYLAGLPFPEEVNGEVDTSDSPRHLLFDLNDCDQERCVEVGIPGTPFWSPSGEKAVYLASGLTISSALLTDGRIWLIDSTPAAVSFPLYLADGAGRPLTGDAPVQVGSGISPFWLDDTHFGFVAGDDNVQQIVVGSDADSIVPILETADLRNALPTDVRLGRLLIRQVLPYPQDPDKLFVITSDIDAQGYVFLVDIGTGEVEYRFSVGLLWNHLMGLSPDGRYLVTNSTQSDESARNYYNTFITIHDIVQNQTQNFLFDGSDAAPGLPFDWSADGNWLLTILDNGLLQLIAPEYNYKQVLAHELGDCQSVAWVNP